MKFILFFILLIITLSKSQYVNFQPYSTSKCSGDSIGLGYSIEVGTCLTFDQNNTYIFKQSSSSVVQWLNYGQYNGDSTCTSSSTQPKQQSAKIGGCIKNVKNQFTFDLNASPVDTYFYKVSVSNTPLVNQNSYIKSYLYNSNSCSENDVTNLSYFTNGTKATNEEGRPYSYYCSGSNQPYTYYCSIWGCGNTNTATSCSSIPSSNYPNNYYSVFCN